jgi:hypothetical protein
VTAEPPPVPIACTLSAGDLPGRCAEWQAFYSSSVLSSERSPRTVRLHLDPSPASVAAARSLARREKECCAFFEFTLASEAGRPVMAVSVPPGAEPTLRSFMEMLRSGREPLS